MKRTRTFVWLAAASLLLSCTSNSAGQTAPQKAEGLDDIQRDDKKSKGKKGRKKGRKGDKAAKPLPPVPNKAVAEVNGVEITNAAFRHIYDLKQQKYADRDKDMPTTADRRYRRSIVERLVYHELLRQEAEKLGIGADPAKLAERIDRQKQGITDWEAHLRRRGESDSSLEAIYVKELVELAVLEKTGALEVTDEDLQAEYEKFKKTFDKPVERIRVSHILVRIGPDPKDPTRPKGKPSEALQQEWDAAALAKAKELAAKARAPGADFAELARTLSDGPSARKGGDLDIVQPDRMPKSFSDVAFALEPGVVSEPVKSQFGFHIIKVAKKYPAGLLPLEAVADQLRERLSLTKLREGRQGLRERLLKEATLVNNMDKWLGPDPRTKNPVRRPDPHGQPDPQVRGAVAESGGPHTISREKHGAHGAKPMPAKPAEPDAAGKPEKPAKPAPAQ